MKESYKITQRPTLKRGTDDENFVLKRRRQQPPIIIGQPIDNVYQFRYTKDGKPMKVPQLDNAVSLVVGIGFTITVLSMDPSNTDDPTDTTNITYIWKYNGNEVYVANNQNKGKGTNTLRFTDSQSRIGLTGVYTCEVTNRYGTTTTAPFQLNILDTARVPLFYRNLIANGSGHDGTEGWEADDQITVSEFAPPNMWINHFGSIDRMVGNKDGDGNLLETQPLNPFRFSMQSNFSSLERYLTDAAFARSIDSAGLWRHCKPNIIQNENPDQNFATFFPSMRYLDEYNKNTQKGDRLELGLSSVSTYFTRKELGFKKDGEPQTVRLSQTIDIANYKNHIDGYVAGVDSILARFFCYIGIGLDKYEYELVTGDLANEGSQVPSDVALFQQAIQKAGFALFSITNIPTNEEIYAKAVEIYTQEGGLFTNASPTILNGEFEKRNTFILSADQLRLVARDTSISKLNLNTVTRINLIPKVHNTANVKITALREGLPPVELASIAGPNEDDLFAVKELAFLSFHLQRVFSNATTAQSIPIYLKDKKICTIGSSATQANTAYINTRIQEQAPDLFAEYYDVQKTNKGVLSDPGAQAFFAVGSSFSIPPKTRSIQIAITMDHNSIAYNNVSPQSGEIVWSESTLYAEHLDTTSVNGQYYKAGLPKIGVTQMKLSLYDNEYSRIPEYSTFFIPQNSIYSLRRRELQIRSVDDSLQPSYFIVAKPDTFYTPTPAEQQEINLDPTSGTIPTRR